MDIKLATIPGLAAARMSIVENNVAEIAHPAADVTRRDILASHMAASAGRLGSQLTETASRTTEDLKSSAHRGTGTRSNPTQTPDDEVIQQIVARIQNRLGCALLDFQIQVREGGLILLGQVNTYYGKQLAQHIVMEVSGLAILANDIEVL